MHINKFILISLISSFSLFSCGVKVRVESCDTNLGSVEYFIKDNKVVLHAHPKDNNLFEAWYVKNDNDNDYRFASADNPCIYKLEANVTIRGLFAEYSNQEFNFNLKEDEYSHQKYFSISKYHGEDVPTDVIIPNTHYGFPVLNIESNTFSGYKNLKSITLAFNTARLEDKAFDNCSVPILNMNSKLYYSYDRFENWTEQQTLYLPKDAVKEKDSKLVTNWDWVLEKGQSGLFYTSSACGNGKPHIIWNKD